MASRVGRAHEDATVEMAVAPDSEAGDQPSGEEMVAKENPAARLATPAMFESSLVFPIRRKTSTGVRETKAKRASASPKQRLRRR